jgi:hypothetical protein
MHPPLHVTPLRSALTKEPDQESRQQQKTFPGLFGAIVKPPSCQNSDRQPPSTFRVRIDSTGSLQRTTVRPPSPLRLANPVRGRGSRSEPETPSLRSRMIAPSAKRAFGGRQTVTTARQPFRRRDIRWMKLSGGNQRGLLSLEGGEIQGCRALRERPTGSGKVVLALDPVSIAF